MMRHEEAYDPACQDLAEFVLSEEPTNSVALAKVHEQRVKALSVQIQQAVEEWLEEYPFAGDVQSRSRI